MVTIRDEVPQDIASIYNVNKEAFGQEKEADLVNNLRVRKVLVISLVAVKDGEIIGHIAFSPVDITPGNSNIKALTLAPLAVKPGYQNMGVGSRLVSTGLEQCRKKGWEIVVLAGHPNYYPRFGFVQARELECEVEVPDEAWMVAELKKGTLSGVKGKVFFQPEFLQPALMK